MEARLVEHFVAERRLREGMDQVTAAVVGDFNSGKSTFINALLQTNLCPTGDEPTTSSVTYFFHGDQKRIEQVEPSGTRKRLTRESYDELVRHRKQGDQVPAVFHISLSSQILEHVRIVDTPGFDAPPPNSNDTEVTEHGVAESDVLFVLMDASRGNPSKALLEQLQRMQQSPAADRQKPMFLLLNKAERLPPSQRAMVSKDNRKKYQALFRDVALISAKLLMNQEDEDGLMSLSTLRSEMVEPVAKKRHTIAEHQFKRRSTQIRADLERMTAWLSDTIERKGAPLVFDEKRALDKIDEVIVEHMEEMCDDALEGAIVSIERKGGMDAELFDKMKKLIADRLEIEEDKITLESSFRQDLGADSLDTYELVYAIEEELGITIPDEKANEFETVKDALAYIESQIKSDTFFSTKFRRQYNAVSKHSAWTEIGKGWKAIVDELTGLTPTSKNQSSILCRSQIQLQKLKGEFLSDIRSADDEMVMPMKTSDDWSWNKEERCWEYETEEDGHWVEEGLRLDYRMSLLLGCVTFTESLREYLRESVVSFASNRAQLQLLRERIGILQEGLE